MSWRDAPVVEPAKSPAPDAAPAWASAPVVDKATEGTGIIDRIASIPGAIKESITGAQRRTETTESLPDWAGMPELNSFSMASFKAALGTMVSSPEESAQVIQANFPGVQVSQDERGNFLLKSSIDGKQYAIKPGFRPSDIPRAGAALAAFTPAGAARTLPSLVAKSAGTQALIETSQAATGGEFNPEDVALAGALAPVVPVAAAGVRAVAKPIAEAARRLAGRPATVAPPPAVAPAAPPAVAPAAMPADELAITAKKAAEGGIGSSRAVKVLAEQSAPKAETVAAARRLGIEEFLQPDHVTSNQAYRELAQAVKSVPGSVTRQAELQGLEQVAQRASRLVDDIGGTRDISALGPAVKQQMQTTHDALRSQADDLYSQVRKAIPAKTSAPAQKTVELIRQRADELGGEQYLTLLERKLLGTFDDATSPPTYARLDDTRIRLNAAKYGKGEEAFVGVDDGLRNRLLSTLRADQEAAATAAGQAETWNLAQKTAAAYKGVEDDLTALFGKALDGTFTGSGATSLQGAIKATAAGDSTRLAKLLAAVPKDMRPQVVATGIGSMFRTAATRGEMNFGAYSKWYEGLRQNRQAYAALMSNLPLSARKQLEALYRVSSGISAATRERITTGRIQAVQQEIQGADTLMANIYGVAKRAAVGIPAEAAATAAGLPGAGISAGIASALTKGKPNALKAADALISSPEFAAAIRSSGSESASSAAKQLARSGAFRRFYMAAKQPRELSQPERWILSSMQAEASNGTQPTAQKALRSDAGQQPAN